ncbi:MULTISPECIES: DUF3892 domain-containing protein [Caloramator]|uniref:DUF3892 domain-containing protein n=1 Tax=Caloramator australicus RC3 TaxID=857293 RepID=I7KTF4_9CLOT|nr:MULTISPECIES: DUF3892 domain-containing protein [Caloramator]MDO6353922.1 DUF3892 domain-containing protein [Caloramator sp. CAR-1]WDU83126.1 DUF3892 domain-containing protein [Caloramator sp. Dgby_cultured_2]CCJ33023.1 hypothetical protein CAAU_0939 [Caloramator australicus RC3]
MLKIVKVLRDNEGKIISYELNSGEIVSQSEAAQMVKEGKIKGAILGVDEYGHPAIHSVLGSNRFDDVENLPEV